MQTESSKENKMTDFKKINICPLCNKEMSEEMIDIGCFGDMNNGEPVMENCPVCHPCEVIELPFSIYKVKE